jgi:oligoribonuclease NrnB/cAMP/cGMP phosphodiesterase (DHH superfamily)
VTVPLPKPTVICTHESDLDGLVAGLLLQRLARHLFGEDILLQAYHNHNWKQRSMTERSAWVCDIAVDSRMDRQEWLILDHHTSDVTPRKAHLIHDLGKSASLLAYELCQLHNLGSPELDRLVHLSNVADLFLEDDPDFIVATDYANLVKVYQFWNLYELIEGKIERLLDHPLLEVMAVKRRIENPLGFSWSKSHVTEISPSVGFVDTVVGNINMIVHRLLEEKATRYQVLITLLRKGNGTILVSLRSRDGQAIKIAEKLHGGGHANAAGAALPKSVSSIPDAVLYLKSALNPPPAKGTPLNGLEGIFAEIELGQK